MAFIKDQERSFYSYLTAISGRKVTKHVMHKRRARQLKINDNYIRNVIAHGVLEDERSVGELEYFLKPLDASGRPAIFVSPHWGAYVQSFVDVAWSLSDGTQFIGLRGDDWNSKEAELWDKFNDASNRNITIHKVLERKHFVKVYKTLKQGAKMLFCFDLFDQYGKTRQIEMFNISMRVTFGWAHLAYKAGAIVIFVAPKSEARGVTELFSVIDPRRYAEETFLVKCTESASSVLEHLITEEPAYWFMWEHMKKYRA